MVVCIECLYFDAFLSFCDEVGLKIKGLLINTSDDFSAIVVVEAFTVAFTVYLSVGSSMVDGRTVRVSYRCLHT